MKQALTFLVFLSLVMVGPTDAQPPATLRGVGATYIEAHGGYSLDAALEAVGAKWWYGWRRLPGGDGVPMVWGRGDLGKPINGNAEWIMFYNEPENGDQAGVEPMPAAADWVIFRTSYPGRRYVSPGCYSVEWLEDWLGRIDVMPDALAAHCYMVQGAEGACKSHLARFVALAQRYGIPEVWVTEFAYVPQPGEGYAGAIAWMADITAWMDAQPTITRYAWFELAYLGSEPWAWGVAQNTSLVDYNTGALTALGEAYRIDTIAYADPRADVDGNKSIDILDLVIVGSSFGRPVR